MKKFLAAFDGYKMSASTMDYAIQIAKAADAHLLGVFLDDFIYHTYNEYKVLTEYKTEAEKVIKELSEKDKTMRDKAALQFQKACGKANIKFSIHRDKSIAIQELKHESMFADLIVINKHETFSRSKEEPPTGFMHDLLSDVQCPVLIVPKMYKPVDKIVLLYDGGPSALHALKMFSYLLGSLQELPVEVYTVKNEHTATLRLPDNKLMREYIKSHFPNASYTVKKGNTEEQITGYMRNHQENELVVLGAYRRSEISMWFKRSMADILMKELDTPLFIAHNK